MIISRAVVTVSSHILKISLVLIASHIFSTFFFVPIINSAWYVLFLSLFLLSCWFLCALVYKQMVSTTECIANICNVIPRQLPAFLHFTNKAGRPGRQNQPHISVKLGERFEQDINRSNTLYIEKDQALFPFELT